MAPDATDAPRSAWTPVTERLERFPREQGARIDPEDVAALAVFLASPGARNITGQSFNVDGGLILD